MQNHGRMRRQTEQNKEGFNCGHCRGWVSTSEFIGTHHRNHCPSCLWSKHVDLKRAGDRKASCGAGMEPIGLTLKQEGFDKYDRARRGELMLIHHCTNKDCGKISINRNAGDDNPATILNVFEASQTIDDSLRYDIIDSGIKLLTKSDEEGIMTQLFGRI